MLWLVAVLWIVYLTECGIRQRPGTVLFRGPRVGSLRPVVPPDIDLFEGRVGLWWTTILPWDIVVVAPDVGSSTKSTRTAIETAISRLRMLRLAAGALFLLLLVVLPVLVVFDRLSAYLLWWASPLVMVWLTTLAAYFRAHREIRGSTPPLEDALTVVLSPMAAIRAPLQLLLHVPADHSAIAVAATVCSNERLLDFLRQVYFDDEQRRGEVEKVLAERGLRARFWEPPAGSRAGEQLFCPRCGTIYADGVTHCVDCRHVELRRA